MQKQILRTFSTKGESATHEMDAIFKRKRKKGSHSCNNRSKLNVLVTPDGEAVFVWRHTGHLMGVPGLNLPIKKIRV